MKCLHALNFLVTFIGINCASGSNGLRKKTQNNTTTKDDNSDLDEQLNTNNDPLSNPTWYPNWSIAPSSNDPEQEFHCLQSTSASPAPAYMIHTKQKQANGYQSMMKHTLMECCTSFFWLELSSCLNSNVDDGEGIGTATTASTSLALLAESSTAATTVAATLSTTTTTTSGTKYHLLGSSVNSNSDNQSDKEEGEEDKPSITNNNWYADYINFKCTSSSSNNNNNSTKQDMTLYSNATACCDAQFPYLVTNYCVEVSTQQQDAEQQYEGSALYYVDYQHGRCAQDCPPNKNNSSSSKDRIVCGGVITETYTKLYSNAESCCSQELSYVDSLLCARRSTPSSIIEENDEGTFRLYPDVASGTCVIDQNPSNTVICSIGYKCQRIPSSSWVSKLYPVSPSGVQDCCANSLLADKVNPEYCASRTMGVPSRKWFVNYEEELCHKDCNPTEGTNCKTNTDPVAAFHDTKEQCCRSKLPHISLSQCLADDSTQVDTGEEYYLDWIYQRCVKNCPVGIEEGDVSCGGAANVKWVEIFPDADACCNRIHYIDRDDCVKPRAL